MTKVIRKKGTNEVVRGRSLEAGVPYLDVAVGNEKREDGSSGGKLLVLGDTKQETLH